MYIVIDDDGNHFTGENIQELIKDVKMNGYGGVDSWDVYEATKIEIVESYAVKKPAAKKAPAKTTVKK